MGSGRRARRAGGRGTEPAEQRQRRGLGSGARAGQGRWRRGMLLGACMCRQRQWRGWRGPWRWRWWCAACCQGHPALLHPAGWWHGPPHRANAAAAASHLGRGAQGRGPRLRGLQAHAVAARASHCPLSGACGGARRLRTAAAVLALALLQHVKLGQQLHGVRGGVWGGERIIRGRWCCCGSSARQVALWHGPTNA